METGSVVVGANRSLMVGEREGRADKQALGTCKESLQTK
jgi:hypothetical protein